MNKLSISETLTKLRISRKLTQRQLGEELGVSESTINTWESGRRSPAPNAREKICEFFNIDLNQLYGINTSNNNEGLFLNNDSILEIEYYDTSLTTSKLTLSKSLLGDDDKYVAYKVTDSNLIYHGILEDDILIFADRLSSNVDSDKIILCLIKCLPRIMFIHNIDDSNFILSNDKTEYKFSKNDTNCIILGQLVTIIRKQF